jgi:hypothetical protein
MHSRPYIPTLFFSVAGFLACGARIDAAETLTVALRSGRTFTAAVDQRTNDSRLWLRFGHGPTVVLRPLAWDAVVAAWRNGEMVPREQLRDVAGEMKTPLLVERESEPSAEPLPPAAAPSHADPQQDYATHDHGPFAPPPRVASVAFDAWLANWDADAAPDGLAVLIQPLDFWGGLLPTDGVVHVELVGLSRRDFISAPHSGGVVQQTLDRWTQSLAAGLPTGDGLLLKLPFHGSPPSPESVASRGRVQVRLVAPGHGVFEEVLDGVPIRPFAPLNESWPAFLKNSSGR